MRSVLLAISLLFALTGCGTAPAVNSTTAASNQPKAAGTPSANQLTTNPQTVTIDSPDGVKLLGSFYPVAQANSPALLLLHQWQSDRHSYDDFAKRESARGFAVLSIDGRGFGESTKKADGSTVTAGRSDEDVKAMLGDVDASVTFLKKQNNVDPKRIGIVGASYGSSLAIMYASDHTDIPAVALLSPGLNYFGNMQTLPALQKYGDRDLYVIASKSDRDSNEAAESFMKIGNTRYGFVILPVGGSHGTEMFKYRNTTDGPPVVEDALEFFLTTRLGLAKADYN